MVAAQNTEVPLYQQQVSPPEVPESSPASRADQASLPAHLPGIPSAFSNPDVLHGDHGKEREADVTIDIADTSKDATMSGPIASASSVPVDPPVRKPFKQDPFGWVMRPRQISKHQRFVLIVFGRIGWCAKAIVYSIIGGLCCQSSVQGRQGSASASPQGAFILIGNNNVGVPLLVVLAVMLALYSGWRYWEGIIGAGTDRDVGRAKNFFRYRLSPLISGSVYLAYMAYILSLLAKTRQQRLTADDNRAFPNSWRNSGGGKFGLAVIGVAFLAAFVAQLEMIFTKAFHREMRQKLNCFIKWTAYISGHIGFAGRAGMFLLVAILFFRTIERNTGDETTIANALYQLQGNAGGRFALFLLGWGLIVYGLYATMCGLYIRVFPTQPRSRNPIIPLEHARHLWNRRREQKLRKREMTHDTLGLEMNGSGTDPKRAVIGHAATNGSDGALTQATNSWAPTADQLAATQPASAFPQQIAPDAVLPPSRVYVPSSTVTQV